MEEQEFTPRFAPPVRLNTPDGPVTLRADLSPVLYDAIIKWMLAYNEAMAAQTEPDWDGIFKLAAEASGVAEEKIREWGKAAAVDTAAFLAGAWGKAVIPPQTPTETPMEEPSSSAPESPSPSKGRSR